MIELAFNFLSIYIHTLNKQCANINQELYLTQNSLNQLISIFKELLELSKKRSEGNRVIIPSNPDGSKYCKKQIQNLNQDKPFFYYQGYRFNIFFKK